LKAEKIIAMIQEEFPFLMKGFDYSFEQEEKSDGRQREETQEFPL
jgi:hypothetical protein